MQYHSDKQQQTVQDLLKRDYVLADQDPDGTILMTRAKQPTSHLLHLVLSILTLGIWLYVWFFIIPLLNSRRSAQVYPDGTTTAYAPIVIGIVALLVVALLVVATPIVIIGAPIVWIGHLVAVRRGDIPADTPWYQLGQRDEADYQAKMADLRQQMSTIKQQAGL